KFFFSSRRRHTRSKRDWSSDVCSSDLFPHEDDFIIFSRNGGVTDPDNLQHYFSRLLRKLGLEHVKFHAIRHTFATRAIENGIDEIGRASCRERGPSSVVEGTMGG